MARWPSGLRRLAATLISKFANDYRSMNYQKHYDLLCERAKTREEPEGYFERHHVIPKCMGGSDDSENIVKLTPEEHYLAHQLLVKMHPDHDGLIWAALQMTGHHTDSRSTNKLYGWLKRRYQHVAKARKGIQNGSFGRFWYHHPETLENVKCLPDEVPEGFVKGRKTTKNSKCIVCQKDTGGKRRKYCDAHLKEKRSSVVKKRNSEKNQYLKGTYYITNGEIDRRLYPNQSIPNGFWKGRTHGKENLRSGGSIGFRRSAAN